jgi:hypothetical protein
MSIETAMPYLVGPGSGIVVCVLVLGAIWRLATQMVVPLIQGAVDRHLQQIDAMVEKHSQEHQAIISALERTERKVGGVLGRLDRAEG